MSQSPTPDVDGNMPHVFSTVELSSLLRQTAELARAHGGTWDPTDEHALSIPPKPPLEDIGDLNQSIHELNVTIRTLTRTLRAWDVAARGTLVSLRNAVWAVGALLGVILPLGVVSLSLIVARV
jgi:hypothetical protein